METSRGTRGVGVVIAALAFAAGAAGSVARAQPLPAAELQQAVEAVVASPDTPFQGAVLAVHRPGWRSTAHRHISGVGGIGLRP